MYGFRGLADDSVTANPTLQSPKSKVSALVGAIDVAPVGQGTSSLIERTHAGHLLSSAEMRSSLHEAELGMEMMVDVMLEDSHYLDKCAERQRRVGSHSRSWHAGATNPTAVRFGNHVSEGGVIQENMAAGQGAEYFGNGEDRDSKVSLGPKRAPFDLRMVKVERGRGVHSGSYTLETLALGPLTRAREEERGGGMHASHTLAQRAQ